MLDAKGHLGIKSLRELFEFLEPTQLKSGGAWHRPIFF